MTSLETEDQKAQIEAFCTALLITLTRRHTLSNVDCDSADE
jgi:hypothetical protein